MNADKLLQYMRSFFKPKTKTREELLKQIGILASEFKAVSLEPTPAPWPSTDCTNLGNIIATLQTTYSRECQII